ncbi:MAG: flippase-like domain-containing protein [Anaerolineae bacterium]|nr:flippase-like domain-containing protein [Anaerolineae bacterium]
MPESRPVPDYTRIARAASSVVFAMVAARYVYVHRNELTVLFSVRGWDIARLVGALFLQSLVGAARFASLYRVLGAHMGLWESFGLSNVATVLNTVLPAQAGGVARAVYLKRRYAIPYSQAPVILLGAMVSSLSIGAAVMIITNTIAVLMAKPVAWALWLGAACAGAPVLLLWVSVPERWTSRLGRVGHMLRLFSDGWQKLRQDARCLAETGLYQILVFVVGGWIIAIAYGGLGVRVSPLVGTSIVVFASFANLVVLTPGNLGIQEAVVGYLSQLSGLAFVDGVAASILIRIVGLMVNFAVAPVAWYLLFLRRGITITENTRTPEDQE